MKRNIIGLMCCTSLVIGADISIYEPIDGFKKKEVVFVADKPSGFESNSLKNDVYMGISGGAMSLNGKSGLSNSLMLGYKVSDFLAFELRYSRLMEDVSEGRDAFKNLAVYMRQMVPLNYNLKPYGLLGYGKTFYNGMSDEQMQWGIGIDYTYSEQVALFCDFESKYNGDFEKSSTDIIELNSLMVGTMYVF